MRFLHAHSRAPQITTMSQHNIKLTYFDFEFARAEPIRLAFAFGKIPFEVRSAPWTEIEGIDPVLV